MNPKYEKEIFRNIMTILVGSSCFLGFTIYSRYFEVTPKTETFIICIKMIVSIVISVSVFILIQLWLNRWFQNEMLKIGFRVASEKLDDMVKNPKERVELVEELGDILEKYFWENRFFREEAWSDLLNVMQIALKNNKEISDDECEVIRSGILKLQEKNIDYDDVTEVVSTWTDAGINVFGYTMTSEEEEDVDDEV